MSKERYRALYGPTTDDVIRLADTNLSVVVEADDVGYGDEPIWGYAKNIRAGMTQYDKVPSASELDVVVAGVVVVDPLLGIRKTNIGIKDGRIVEGQGAQVSAMALTWSSDPTPCPSWGTG